MASIYKTLQLSIKSLEKAPRELYLNYILKFCESYNYFAISQILVIFLHNEFHFTDLEAGTTYGLWGTAITFWGLCCATFNDRLGVRNSLLIGFSLSAISTFSMALVTSKTIMQFILYVALPLGNCMGMPMLTVGIRRYTTTINRGFAFGLFYSVMNIGAFVSGPVIDILNIHVTGSSSSGNDNTGDSNSGSSSSSGNSNTMTLFGIAMTGNRLVILTATLSSCFSFFITLFFLREICVQENDDDDDDDDDDDVEIANKRNNIESNVVDKVASSTAAAATDDDEDDGNDDDDVDDGKSFLSLTKTESMLTDSSNNTNNNLNTNHHNSSNDTNNNNTINNYTNNHNHHNYSVNHNNANISINNNNNNNGDDYDDDVCAKPAVILIKNEGSVYNPIAPPLISYNDDDDDDDYDAHNHHKHHHHGNYSNISSNNNSTTNINNSNINSNNNNNSSSSSSNSNNYNTATATTTTSGMTHQWRMIQELCMSVTFWRFVGFTLLLINLKAVFRHLDATLPTYLVRTFGPNVPKGTIYSINPFMIMFLTPLVSALTTQYAHYDMIKYGGYLTAISPFFLAISESIPAAVGMIVVLSLGEAIWSPRTYDYTMSIAPEGREASFSALATAPLFLATVPVGLMSGYLMAEYIPEEGHRNSCMMWLIIGCVTMSSPVLITLLERYVREPVHTTGGESDDANDVMRNTNNNAFTTDGDIDDDDDDDGGKYSIVLTSIR